MKVKKIGDTQEKTVVNHNEPGPAKEVIESTPSEMPGEINKTKYYLIGGGLLAVIAILLYFLLFKNSDKTFDTDIIPQDTKTKNTVEQKENKTPNVPPVEKEKNIDLNGTYNGSIKDGTRWYVYIFEFDGKNFSGHNQIFWKKYPDGFNTNFTGTYDSKTGQIIMYEDRNAKGSGKFTGTVSENGKIMSGDWHRYSDNGSFTWNLKKSGIKD
jgi:hypothetical protein